MRILRCLNLINLLQVLLKESSNWWRVQYAREWVGKVSCKGEDKNDTSTRFFLKGCRSRTLYCNGRTTESMQTKRREKETVVWDPYSNHAPRVGASLAIGLEKVLIGSLQF